VSDSRGFRLLGLALLGLAIMAGALLGLMAARASGPAVVTRHGVNTDRHATATEQSRAKSNRYGTQLAPASERVNVTLKRGLRSGLLFDVRTGEVLWRPRAMTRRSRSPSTLPALNEGSSR
jgi:hypothetical protein